MNTGPSKGTYWDGITEKNANRFKEQIEKINKNNLPSDVKTPEGTLKFPNPPLQAGEDRRGFFSRYIGSPVVFLVTSPLKLFV